MILCAEDDLFKVHIEIAYYNLRQGSDYIHGRIVKDMLCDLADLKEKPFREIYLELTCEDTIQTPTDIVYRYMHLQNANSEMARQFRNDIGANDPKAVELLVNALTKLTVDHL